MQEILTTIYFKEKKLYYIDDEKRGLYLYEDVY